MGDSCYLEITLQKADLDGFGRILGEPAAATWWNEDLDEPAEGVVRLGVCEANYAWWDQRTKAAAAGIPFLGQHTEGGEYGAHGFASLNGAHVEAPLDRDGNIVMAVDDALKPIGNKAGLRQYVKTRRAVGKLFGLACK